MAVSFAANPAELYTVSNQSLIYTLEDSSPLGTGYRFVVWVKEYDNTTATEIAKLYLTPNTNDKAHFDLSKIVKDRVKVDSEEDTGTNVIHKEQSVSVSTTNSRKYLINIGSYTTAGGEVDPDVSKFIYLIDGAFQVTSGINPPFTDYYPTTIVSLQKKSWLTDRWDDNNQGGVDNDAIEYRLADDDEAVAAWIHDSTVISGIDDKVYLALFNDSGMVGFSSHLITSLGGDALTSTNYNRKVHYLGIGPSNINAWADYNPTTDPDWTYYIVRLQDNRDMCSKYIKVIRDCGNLRGQRVQLAYTNRLGGWDYLIFDGFNTKEETKSDKPYLKQIGDWDASVYTFESYSRERQSAQVETTKSYTLKTNRFNVEDFYCLQGALRSDNVMIFFHKMQGTSSFVEDNDKWLPVNIKDSNYQIRDFSNAKVYDVTVKVELAQQIRC